MIVKDEKKIKYNFSKLAVIFLIYELGLLYVKHFINQDFIETIAYNYNYTLGSLDLLLSGLIMLVLSLVIILSLYLLNGHSKFTYEVSKLTLIDFITLLLLVLGTNLFTNYVLSEICNYSGASIVLLMPIGILQRFDVSSPIYIIYFLLLFPIFEELIFRKFLLNYLRRYGFRFAIIISSLIFALAHNDVFYFIPALAFGILLSSITLKYNNFLIALLIHVINNCFFYLPYVINSKFYWILVIAVFLIFIIGSYLVFGRGKFIIQFSNKFYNRAIYLFYTNPLVIIMFMAFIAGNVLNNYLK